MNDYQTLQEENKQLKNQVEKLEDKVKYLSEIIASKKESNSKLFEKYTLRGREIKRLKVHISFLEEKLKKSEEDGATE